MEGRTIIKRSIVGLVVAIIAGYSYFVFYDFIRGPRIILTTPETGFSTTTAHIMIAGRAIHINSLFLNDAAIPFDLDGNFSESLLLADGYNIIKIIAEDRYKRTVEKTIEMNLLVKEITEVMATTTPPVLRVYKTTTTTSPTTVTGFASSTATSTDVTSSTATSTDTEIASSTASTTIIINF